MNRLPQPAPNLMGSDRFQIIERTYMPSLIPGCPPVLVKTVEGKFQLF